MDNSYHQNLITLLKLFKNRPYHLAKFLIENSALNDKFISSLNNSKLSDISKNQQSEKSLNFFNISEMNDFYDSLIDDKELISKSKKDLEVEFNLKLDNLIKLEKFEEAAYIRDVMKRKNIKRNSK